MSGMQEEQEYALDARVVSAIEEKKKQVDNIIKGAEENFRRNIEANLTYHRFMLESAIDQRQPGRTAHHQVMIDIYESILSNVRSAKSLDPTG